MLSVLLNTGLDWGGGERTASHPEPRHLLGEGLQLLCQQRVLQARGVQAPQLAVSVGLLGLLCARVRVFCGCLVTRYPSAARSPSPSASPRSCCCTSTGVPSPTAARRTRAVKYLQSDTTPWKGATFPVMLCACTNTLVVPQHFRARSAGHSLLHRLFDLLVRCCVRGVVGSVPE